MIGLLRSLLRIWLRACVDPWFWWEVEKRGENETSRDKRRTSELN